MHILPNLTQLPSPASQSAHEGDSQSSCIAKSGVRNIIFLHQPHKRAFNFTLQKSFLKSQSPLPPPLSLLCLQRTLQTAIVYWKDSQFQSKFSIIFSVTLISRIQGFHALIISMSYSYSRIQGFSCSHHLHVTFSSWNPRVLMALIISPWNSTKNIITHYAARFSDFPQRNPTTHLHHPCMHQYTNSFMQLQTNPSKNSPSILLKMKNDNHNNNNDDEDQPMHTIYLGF